MQTYQGSCHCGAVTFEVTGTYDEVHICDCSICIKKGIIHIPVEDDHFRVTMGQEHLSNYQFGSKAASHYFCSNCGIHVFGRPRMDPNRNTVNIRCLDEFEQIMSQSRQIHFNGKHHPLDD